MPARTPKAGRVCVRAPSCRKRKCRGVFLETDPRAWSQENVITAVDVFRRSFTLSPSRSAARERLAASRGRPTPKEQPPPETLRHQGPRGSGGCSGKQGRAFTCVSGADPHRRSKPDPASRSQATPSVNLSGLGTEGGITDAVANRRVRCPVCRRPHVGTPYRISQSHSS